VVKVRYVRIGEVVFSHEHIISQAINISLEKSNFSSGIRPQVVFRFLSLTTEVTNLICVVIQIEARLSDKLWRHLFIKDCLNAMYEHNCVDIKYRPRLTG
jgi:hypothetical protein